MTIPLEKLCVQLGIDINRAKSYIKESKYDKFGNEVLCHNGRTHTQK